MANDTEIVGAYTRMHVNLLPVYLTFRRLCTVALSFLV